MECIEYAWDLMNMYEILMKVNEMYTIYVYMIFHEYVRDIEENQ